MPSRNIYKEYLDNSYYHVYNRGINRQRIFNNTKDYVVFLSLLKRYLGSEPSKKSSGIIHPSFRDKIELLAFCLMPTHYHLLLYQEDKKSLPLFLKSLGVSYGMYFNKRYRRVGPIFQQRYKGSRISDDSYLLHISRYIHLNPDNFSNWQWSSLPYFLAKKSADWVKPNRVLDMFEGDKYLEFLKDYKSRRDLLEEIKHQLADQ